MRSRPLPAPPSEGKDYERHFRKESSGLLRLPVARQGGRLEGLPNLTSRRPLLHWRLGHRFRGNETASSLVQSMLGSSAIGYG
jgi:hypothetical protein